MATGSKERTERNGGRQVSPKTQSLWSAKQAKATGLAVHLSCEIRYTLHGQSEEEFFGDQALVQVRF